MNFKDFVQKETPAIQSAIDAVFADWQNSVKQWTPELIQMNQLLIEQTKGGKMLRGVLIKLGYDIHSSVLQKDIYKIAAAYEILHTALLIHDDVIDKARLRRGIPTVAQALGGNHYGNAQAICIGDIGMFLAQQTISKSAFSDRIKMRIIAELSKISLKTMLGEMLDIRASQQKNKKNEEVLSIAEFKTAYYTVAGPLHIGAIMAGENSEKQYALRQHFGVNLGIAFQIKDDILGVFSDEKILGKSVDSDIQEGKNTLLIIYALAHSYPKQKQFLKKYYGKKSISSDELNTIRNIFQETGSLVHSEKIIQEYIHKAEEDIPLLTKDERWQRILHDGIAFVIKRKK